MAMPSIEVLQQATTELLKEAGAEGQLSNLTVRIVREKLEKRLELSPGTLDEKKYKAPIKSTVVDYLAKDSPVNKVDEEDSQPKTPKKRKLKADEELVETRKSTSIAKTSSKGTKGKQVPKSSALVESEASESYEDKVPTRKRHFGPAINKASQVRSDDDIHEAKPVSKKVSKKKNLASRSTANTYKSAATVESSGDEADVTPSKTVLKKELQSPKKSPSKEKPLSKHKSTIKANVEQMDGESNPGASSATSVKHPPLKSKVEARGESESDSSLSTVIDEPPKKRKKKQDKDSSKKGPTERQKARKSNSGGLAKDDEAVSKLKAIVVACGVRKVWKKEFADLDTPSGQVRRLKEILKDLGMSGRPSLEKAKSLRAQRELAQELKDVQEFAEASRKREMRKEKGENSDSGSESDEEDEGPPTKKKRTAGASILAFLQDQSDEE